MKLDLEKKKNLDPLNNVELASAVTSVLPKLSMKDEVKMKFQKVCVAIIVIIIAKLKKRCPLNFSIVRNAICLSPIEILHNTDTSVIRANILILEKHDASIFSSEEIDKAKQEYQAFLNFVLVTSKEKFLSLHEDVDRLDSFLSSFVKGDTKCVNLLKV